MKIALLAPAYPLEEYPSPPLGLSYAAAAFEQAGAEVQIWDFIVQEYSHQKLAQFLADFDPDIIGATAVTMNFYSAQKALKKAKEINPELITIMGGPHVSFTPELTLRQHPEIDLLVLGEGEGTIANLVPVLKDRKKWNQVQGIAFCDQGQVIRTLPRGLIQDLNTLPLPARHLLPMSKYLALGFPVSIITSRGCPNKCIFCQGRRMVGQKVRYRDPEKIIEEIRSLLKAGFTRINFADDFFTSNKRRVKEVCTLILEEGLEFKWSAFARVDSVNQECLELMLRAGCDTVSFGVESGDEEMLRRIRKRISRKQVEEAVSLCKKVGMKCLISFIAGLPGEDHKSLQTTHDFALNLKERYDVIFGYHLLAPFPGTTLREQIQDFDLTILTDDWNRYDANQAIVQTSKLSAQELERFVHDFEQEVREEWDKTKQRCAQGLGSPEEEFQVMGEKRTNLIFALLQQDLIERLGQVGGQENGHLGPLAAKIAAQVAMEKPFVQEVLEDLKDKGYLRQIKQESASRWTWT